MKMKTIEGVEYTKIRFGFLVGSEVREFGFLLTPEDARATWDKIDMGSSEPIRFTGRECKEPHGEMSVSLSQKLMMYVTAE